MLKIVSGLIGIGLTLAMVSGAGAQQASRPRGQIEKVDGSVLTLKTREGAALTIKLADDARVGALVKASVDDLKADSFVGIAGLPLPDGGIGAFSIHIFLPAQRGVVADRHGPWDALPNSTMTNAYVGDISKSADGEVLVVKYKDGEKKVVVSPQTVVTAVAPGNKSELTVGAQIIVMASEKQADGSVLAKALYVGRGLTPPM